MKINSNQNNDDGHFSSWGNEKNSFRGIENTYKNGFNLNMFQPSGKGTPSRETNSDAVEESTIVRRAVEDIKKIDGEAIPTDIVVHSNTIHINNIGSTNKGNNLVTPGSKDFMLCMATPDGIIAPKGMVLQILGNLYGLPSS